MERDSGRHQFALAASLCICLAAGTVLAVSRSCTSGSVAESVQEESPERESGLASDLSRSTELELSSLPLEDEATRRLEDYRNSGACALECAGYLDLYGNAWGCLVQGDGWVEILVIREAAGESCSVQTIRLEARP